MAKKKIDYASLFTLRRDGRYMGHWKDKKGVRHAVYHRDPAALYALIEEKENAPEPVVTFGQMAEEWEREHFPALHRGTQANYAATLRALLKEFEHTPVREITAAEVNRLLFREKAKGYSYKHAATVKSVLKQVLDHAVIAGHLQFNPAYSVTVPRGLPKKHIEAPDESVVETMVRSLHLPFGDFVAMLLYTGMRTEEAAALTWADVGRDYIIVHAAVDLHGTPVLKEAKTEAGRRLVPILDKHRPFLVMPADAKKTDYIFNDNGKLLTRGQLTARWERWCRDAGLAERREYQSRRKDGTVRTAREWRPLVKPHQLRHNYATVLYEQKVDLLTAKDVMGHKDISTTQKIYTSLRQKHREEEIAKINGGF